MEKSLEQLMTEHFEFTSKTFTKATHLSSLIKLAGDHYEGEVQEVAMAITGGLPVEVKAEEYADCFMCLTDSMGRAGVTPEMLATAFAKKLEKNKKREWMENPDGTYSHVKRPRCANCLERNRIKDGNSICDKCVAELYDENK